MTTRADEIIQAFALEPHPEGGYYREFFRSGLSVTPGDGCGERSALSAIYFLLRGGCASRWHSVRSDEQWTFLEGDAVELLVLERATLELTAHLLGSAGAAGVRTLVVPGGSWQAARTTAGHALVTCTVGPGFDFADFQLMVDDADAAARLRSSAPALARFL